MYKLICRFPRAGLHNDMQVVAASWFTLSVVDGIDKPFPKVTSWQIVLKVGIIGLRVNVECVILTLHLSDSPLEEAHFGHMST